MTPRRSFIFSVLLVGLGASRYLPAQSEGTSDPVSVTTTVSRNTITVGDQFQLTVEVTYNREFVVQLPGPKIPLGGFELLDHQYTSLSEDPHGNILAGSKYTLTAFSTGELEIPSITVRYREGTGEERTLMTEPLSITVESVLTENAEDIKDIKPPFEIPRDWLPLLLAFAAGAAVIAALMVWRRHRKSVQKGAGNALPDLPPHIAAFRALNRLSNSGLLDRGDMIRYHVKVSEIIRRYFAERFGIDALEMTSGELLTSLPRKVPLSAPADLLRQCDLVKFAKFSPSRNQSGRVLELAYEIVETTKPRYEEESSNSPLVRESAISDEIQTGRGGG